MLALFSNELEKGTGLPLLMLQKKLVEADENTDKVLLDNIFKNKSYDPQSEGSRHKYIFKIVESYSNKDMIYQAVINEFKKITRWDYGEEQIFGFVAELARIGKFPKDEMYRKFDSCARLSDSDLILGMDSIIPDEGKNRRSLDEIIAKIKENNVVPFRSWLRKASNEEITRLSALFYDTKNILVRKKIIAQFDEIKPDIRYEDLLAEYKNTRDVFYRISLIETMILYNDKTLRKIADGLFSKDYFAVKLKVLVNFYENTDKELLLEELNLLDEHSCHSILGFIIQNKHIQGFSIYKDILYCLYRINKCSLCRFDVFAKMCEYNFLDINTCSECFYDANMDICKKAHIYFQENFA